MNSPTKAIDNLWMDEFFKDKKKTADVTSKLRDLGLNHGNVTDLLRKRKYLRNKNGFWIQKHPYVKKEDEIDFSMKTDKCENGESWFDCSCSTTLLVFYGGLLLVHIIIILIL